MPPKSQITSFKIANDLFLVRQQVSANAPPAKPAEVPTNHILVTDCSGSMWGEVDKIRQQIKNKLPSLIGEQDTLTLIYFSGRGDFGTFVEAEPVRTMKDLSKIHAAIDSGLRVRGLTGFKEPIEEVSRIVERVGKKNPGSVFNLLFMSDGCDNVWPRADILKAVEKAAGGLASATFVEYGYYADRPLLTAMAEKAGGNLIFAQAFDKYMPQVEAVLAKRPTGAKRIEAKISGDPVGGFAFTAKAGELATYAVEASGVKVPEDTAEIYYLSPSKVGDAGGDVNGKTDSDGILGAAYAALSLFSVRMQPNVVFPLLKALGDVSFIEKFSSCFGKQKYSAFMDDAKAATFDPKLRLVKGYDPKKVPADDAFTVLDFLQLLANDDSARVLLDHKDFEYNRISRGRLDASEVMTPEEQKQVTEITTKMASEKNAKKLKELQEELAKLTASKQEALKFEATPAPGGYEISNLTFNEDRPNISILVRKEGTVDISARLPDAFKGKIPSPFPTNIYRNYAIVQDGLVNVKKLPIRVSKALGDKLTKLLPEEAKPTNVTISGDFIEGTINLEALPVINRKMVKAASAKTLFESQFELEKARAAQKVYKAFKDGRVPKKESASFKVTYGDDGAEWLKEQGFTDYSGWAPPKTTQAESTDFYVGKALLVSIGGYSKLPSMNEFKKQATSGKFNAPGLLMKPYVDEVEAYLKKEQPSDADFIKWIDGKAKASVADARKRIFEIAQQKFAIVIGQVWFTEFASIDENQLSIEVPSPADSKTKIKLDGKVEMKEVQINI